MFFELEVIHESFKENRNIKLHIQPSIGLNIIFEDGTFEIYELFWSVEYNKTSAKVRKSNKY